ncbi:hypothetical protein AMJ83_10455 [candidate division WOR_3 bacterium SM23_42]|uniref:SnoaL-like domain-containing protein n=1 Tax=candidate division WOR_3 bacterium SM23_42 TaxID=1703779 RepID=A0A0S8FPA0_UNCW3|nr:MAG: hypothetical protein AMJ83_10455 [candidate division WOR_3 bacterium SM23_42]
MKKIYVAIAIIVLVIMVWKLIPTEKRKLEKDILNIRKAFENENAQQVVQYIDPAYQDLSGRTHEEITQVIAQFFTEVDSIRVQMSGLKLSIDSTDEDNVTFASCSLGIRVLARYEGEKVLAFGGVVRPGPVRAFFRKTADRYRIYHAEY